ncbi:MAG: hypothetical protein ACYSR7_03205, partial [Planctomycetota bacterium]
MWIFQPAPVAHRKALDSLTSEIVLVLLPLLPAQFRLNYRITMPALSRQCMKFNTCCLNVLEAKIIHINKPIPL